MFYTGGMDLRATGNTAASSRASDAMSLATQHQHAIRELERHVNRLALLNQAMWEIIRDRAGMTDRDLEELARQIDLRDGQEDGKMTAQAVRCPACDRICNSKHSKCLYCGQLFEKPLFG
jgi:hypothetical protein